MPEPSILRNQVSDSDLQALPKRFEITLQLIDSIAKGDLLNALNGITKTLKAIQDAVKEDPALNKKVIEATEAYTKNSIHLTERLKLVKNFNFQGLKSSVESLQATEISQDQHLAEWAKSSTSIAWNLGSRMTAIEISQAEIRTEVSSLKQDTSDFKSMMTKIYQAFKVVTEEPPSHTEGETEYMETQDTDKDKVERNKCPKNQNMEGKGIATDDQPEQTKLVKASSIMRPDLDAPILVPYMINGKLFYLTEEQIKAHLDKEDQIKKAEEEAKALAMTKTEVIKIVQEEAEKIGIDPKKFISVKAGEKFKKAQDAEMQGYERLKKIPEELGIQSALPALVAEKDQSQSSGRKRKHMELEPEIKVPGLEFNRSLPEGVSFINNMVIEEPEYEIFFIDVYGDQAFQIWNDIHKVRVDSLVSYLVIASMVKTLENARSGLKLRKFFAEHPDQEKLQSKKVRLEALGYKLD
ncbi:hypothetical protein Tco_0784776 [Tanacetum coccineum]